MIRKMGEEVQVKFFNEELKKNFTSVDAVYKYEATNCGVMWVDFKILTLRSNYL